MIRAGHQVGVKLGHVVFETLFSTRTLPGDVLGRKVISLEGITSGFHPVRGSRATVAEMAEFVGLQHPATVFFSGLVQKRDKAQRLKTSRLALAIDEVEHDQLKCVCSGHFSIPFAFQRLAVGISARERSMGSKSPPNFRRRRAGKGVLARRENARHLAAYGQPIFAGAQSIKTGRARGRVTSPFCARRS